MPFILKFEQIKFKLKEDQKEEFERIKKKYDNKLCTTREDIKKIQDELDNDLSKLTGKKNNIVKWGCKYGAHTMLTLAGVVRTMIKYAATPEEKSKWEKWNEKLYNAYSEAEEKYFEKIGDADFEFKIIPDTVANVATGYYSEEEEEKLGDFLKELDAAVKEELRKAPLPGEEITNDDIRRNTLEIIATYTGAAINGSLDEEITKTDDYMAGNIGGFIPGISYYGEGHDSNNYPYVSDYARFEHVVPLHAPIIKIQRLVRGNAEYQNLGTKATKEDEMKVREQILSEGADCMYAIDKISKNMENEKIKSVFPREVKGAYTDSIGERGQLRKWAPMHLARRKLIVNGWCMSDVMAIGSLVLLTGPSIDGQIENNKKLWDDYNKDLKRYNEVIVLPENQEKLRKYEAELREYKDKAKRGEEAVKPKDPDVPSKPPRPTFDLYSEKELESLRKLREKIDAVVNEAPGTEERRKEILDSLLSEIDALPKEFKNRYRSLPGITENLRRAAAHELTQAEKDILKDPAAFREMEKLYPIKQYTEAEQQKDLAWLDNILEKDKELNDIFKAEPYAYDKIREIQALSVDNPHFLAEAVKKCIGDEEWNKYQAREGRESDDLKAIDILTHPDSRFRVSNNHKLLSDVENEVRARIISVPQKNVSSIGSHEITSILHYLGNALPSISPGYDFIAKQEEVEKELESGTAFDRQNEYVEHLNKVMSDPGNLTPLQQREEIGRCIAGILTPIGREAIYFEGNNKLFNKENPTEEDKKKMDSSYYFPFGKKGGLMSASYAEKMKPVMVLMDKALKRAEDLMIQDGHEVSVINLRPIQKMVKNAINGTTAMKIHLMDPLIHIPEPNMYAPVALEIDRQKNPIKEGSTRDFTFQEVEEKKEVFPLHKAVNAEYELQKIWGEYLTERQKGPVSDEREREYWNRINGQYNEINTVLTGLAEENRKDPDFAQKNMRCLVGMGSIKESFNDVVDGDRGMIARLKYVKGRQEAFNNGWSLSNLGFYSHFEEVARRIDKNIETVERVGGATAEKFTKGLRGLSTYLKDNMLGKPYEKDPLKRAEIYKGIADRVQSLYEEKERLLADKSISSDLERGIKAVYDANDALSLDSEGMIPFDYEARMYQKEAEIEAAEKAREQLDEIKNIADPIVYNELKYLADTHQEPPRQDFMIIDSSFVGKADIYLNSGMGSLAREIEAVKQGRETTLSAKTGMTHEKAVDAVYSMLNAADSLFHVDSKQYKVIKEGLNKIRSGNATPEDREKLTKDVKTWLTDPKYDRINKHSKNDFDNTRFNVMFTLANELDPAWAKENFPDMNIAGLHGEKAANTSFHNVHEFTNFMHRQMADGGFLRSVEAVGSQHWYLRTDSYGQKGLVEEVLRLRQDAAYTETDSLNAELSNLNKLAGTAANMNLDSAFCGNLPTLDEYRKKVDKLVSEMRNFESQQLTDEKSALNEMRNSAINEIKTYLDDSKNMGKSTYNKAVLAFGVLDPKGAHNYIIALHERKNMKDKVKSVNLVTLEKEQGLDLGGRKALRQKKAAAAVAAKKEAKQEQVRGMN